MCGIVGFINYGSKELLIKATDSMNHRGPDNGSYFFDSEKRCGLGHRRLSIIDLSNEANQPFWSEDGNSAIVFNGEIFNFKEVKELLKNKGVSFRSESDTEVLLKGYNLLGEKILDLLNGMFSFIIFNKSNNQFFIARDRLGIKPLYYFNSGEQLIFASEIKAILRGGIAPQPDKEALITPIHYQSAPLTGFKDISKFAPAHYMICNSNGQVLKYERYWNLEVNENKTRSFEDRVEELDSLLNSSVQYQMVADVPVGIMLSGGLDSSLIAALMRNHTSKKISSFTIKISDSDLKKQGISNDSKYAEIVANKFGFNHNVLEIKPNIIELLPKMAFHLEEILIDPAAVNTYLISKLARESSIPVLLSGIGADEIFAGYRIHKALNRLNSGGILLNNPLIAKLSRAALHIPEGTQGNISKYLRWSKKIALLLSLNQNERHIFAKDSAITKSLHSQLFSGIYNFDSLYHIVKERELFNSQDSSYLNQICYVDSQSYLIDHNLNYLDKSMMAASIEGRPPLLDHRIVEFAFSLPSEYKINSIEQKHILKQSASKYLDAQILNRAKAPFAAPLRSWLKTDLKPMVFELITKQSVDSRGIYNFKAVDRILKEHYSHKSDHSQLIFRLLYTELWFSRFFDNFDS